MVQFSVNLLDEGESVLSLELVTKFLPSVQDKVEE